jgi:hypothetical protein
MRMLDAVGAALALCSLTACSAGSPVSTSSTTGPASATATELPCTGAVVTGPLPTWAREGFEPPDQSVPHVVGIGGDIVGVVFAQPLHALGPAGAENKILWVARPGATADSGDSLGTELAIRARLNGVGTTTSTTLAGGPGPSVVDVPAPGCWTVTLTWSGRTDLVALPYQA